MTHKVTARELREIMVHNHDFEVRNHEMVWEYIADSNDETENTGIVREYGEEYSKIENGKIYTLT